MPLHEQATTKQKRDRDSVLMLKNMRHEFFGEANHKDCNELLVLSECQKGDL